jgi:AMP nucleosidase
MPLPHPTAPPFIAPMRFTDADAALAQVMRIYEGNIAHLRQAMQDWRVPTVPPPSVPRRQVPGAQVVPRVPRGLLRPLPRA